MHSNVLHFGLKPVKFPRSKVILGFDPDSPWVCYSNQGRFAFLPRPLADDFDHILGYRNVGVHRIFGIEEIDAMRTKVALFGITFGTVDTFIAGLHHVRRQGDVLDPASGRKEAA